ASDGQLDGHRFMEETQRLMERTREMTSRQGDEAGPSAALYDEAERLMQQAREMLSEGKSEEALRTMRQVRSMLRKSVDAAGPGQDAAAAEDEIDGVIRLRDSMEEIVNGCSADAARKLFARAENRLGNAMDHFEAGRIERAQAEARIARNLFQRIREICSE
ncbi:MAG TPA: hypothetical protein VLA34_11235, partial [Candidatus Krumholzibacterium sp.]|nr:hypothetical protein [Candidatus Krumholzibacterium sp.]